MRSHLIWLRCGILLKNHFVAKIFQWSDGIWHGDRAVHHSLFFIMLIFLSAMKQIPPELYEAARVDGAGGIYSFFRITLPLLTPTIFFNLVMQLINGFMVFAQGQIITDGKPMNSTLFYVLYMYQQSFEYSKVGYAAAMGWILLVLVALFTGLLFKTKKYWVYE